MRNFIIFLILSLLFGCDQPKVYYKLPEEIPPSFKIYIEVPDAKPLFKDADGNYHVNVDSSVMYTSTTYKELANTRSYFSLGGETIFISDEEFIKKYKCDVIRNIVGKNETTPDGFAIPHYFEIIFEKQK